MSFDLSLKQGPVINGHENQLNGHELQLKPGVNMSKLVGVPHLFGRFLDTRDGFLIDPIGVLIMQPDGRITDYSNPNEGSWIPYDHGVNQSTYPIFQELL